jgi:protein-serine/threonine kinase
LFGDMNNNPPQQQQPQRLQLNFGFGADRNTAAADGRQFPTTPSTFPQPVYPNQNGQQEIWGAQQSNTGFGAPSYFMNNPYQQQFPPQAANNMPPPGAGGANAAPAAAASHQFRAPPQAAATFNDATNGLAQQFAHQNLGGNTPRSASPYARQPSPNANPQQPHPTHQAHQPHQQQQQQRPRTAGSTPQQGQYGNFLSPQVPAQNLLSLNDEEPPPKNPDKFADNVVRKAKVSTGLVNTFFKDNVQRARDRNGRCVASLHG